MRYAILIFRKGQSHSRELVDADSPSEALKKSMHLLKNTDTQIIAEVWDDNIGSGGGYVIYAIPNCGWWTDSSTANRGLVEF